MLSEFSLKKHFLNYISVSQCLAHLPRLLLLLLVLLAVASSWLAKLDGVEHVFRVLREPPLEQKLGFARRLWHQKLVYQWELLVDRTFANQKILQVGLLN